MISVSDSTYDYAGSDIGNDSEVTGSNITDALNALLGGDLNNAISAADIGNPTHSYNLVDRHKVNGFTTSVSWSTAISSNGKYMLAVTDNGFVGDDIHISSDYGVTWRTVAGTNTVYSSCAMSASGEHMVCSSMSNCLYISHNYGVTWTQVIMPIACGEVDVSFDGKYGIVMGNFGGQPYVSSDYLVTWSLPNSPPAVSDYWATGISADGKYMLALDINSVVAPQISTDYGQSWSTITGMVAGVWYGGSISGTGKHMGIINNAGQVFLSHDYGVSLSLIHI